MFKIKRLHLKYKQTSYHIAAYFDEAKIKSDTIAGGKFAGDGKILYIGYLVLEKTGSISLLKMGINLYH